MKLKELYPEAYCPECNSDGIYVGKEKYPEATFYYYYCCECDKEFEKEKKR